jgi:hypothetical protein
MDSMRYFPRAVRKSIPANNRATAQQEVIVQDPRVSEQAHCRPLSCSLGICLPGAGGSWGHTLVSQLFRQASKVNWNSTYLLCKDIVRTTFYWMVAQGSLLRLCNIILS